MKVWVSSSLPPDPSHFLMYNIRFVLVEYDSCRFLPWTGGMVIIHILLDEGAVNIMMVAPSAAIQDYGRNPEKERKTKFRPVHARVALLERKKR